MKLVQARDLALVWSDELQPYCARLAIAGSIRRGKSEVHDIEIVCVPNMVPEQIGLFTGVDFPDEPAPKISAMNAALEMNERGWEFNLLKNGDRLKQMALPQGINLELYVVLPPAQFGCIYAIRTGPAEYSHWLVSPKRYGGGMPFHLRQRDGSLWNGATQIETPEEEDYFRALGLAWCEPYNRFPPAGWKPRKK